MEKLSPPPCSSSVTLRRNPHRRARQTLPTAVTKIRNFPVDEILSMDLHPNSSPSKPAVPSIDSQSESLRVFLRVRPLSIASSSRVAPKSRKPVAKKMSKSCVFVNDSSSVTVTPPCDSTRLKSELYNGFAHVFSSTSSQDDVYEKLMRPNVEEFLNGRSVLLAALGPSGSGKTHTVFGSAKEPGLVPRALRHIFELDMQNGSKVARSFYLSIFEICSEKGKGEKLCDLSPYGADIHMQQSVIVGLKEVLVSDVAEAESLLAHAKSKRATATTNSNSQSSRSQCIINIRRALDEIDGESKSHLNGAVLTFVDLAGAERERKTGNQGGRLLESNFINNTSMVFGLCLRSLLEHQKNPKKPLQKHFQSSLLTRYLRDYLEGRKRMSLILTVRSGEEDYFDTSFLLRQASPYTEIKFHNVEETSNLPRKKRQLQTFCARQQKRVKLSDTVVCRDYVKKTIGGSNEINKETELVEVLSESERDQIPSINANSGPKTAYPRGKTESQYLVMCGFAKALWNTLKQYKERVKTLQDEIDVLTKNLRLGHDQYLVMEKELRDLKSRCCCDKQVRLENTSSEEDINSDFRVRMAKESPDHGNLALEEECPRNDIKSSKAGISDSEEGNVVVGSMIMPVKPKELQGSESADLCEVLSGHFPAKTQCFDSIDENSKSNAILRNPSQDAPFPSSDFETSVQQSSQVQHSTMACRSLHDQVSGSESREENLSKNYDKEATGTVTCLPKPLVKDLRVQGERSVCDTHGEEDKENVVAMDQTSNINLDPDTKQSSVTRPSNTKRPKRRLMPASTLLLRDVSSIGISGESEMPKRGGGRQRLVEDDIKQTRGSASLVRLLKNHLPR